MTAPRRGPPAAQLAAEYKAGATLHELEQRHGVSASTIRRKLAEIGVVRRPARERPAAPHPAASPVVRQLAAAISERNQAQIMRRAGVSAHFWRDARSGKCTPTLALLEAMANAAGYEIVLRRRLVAVARMEDAA